MKNRPHVRHTDVTKLPAELRRLVEQMLIEGATFQDTVQAVNERDSRGISLTAVENFFRGNLKLQQDRIRHQVTTVQALKKALGDPKSGQAQLADAALLTGLMRLNKPGSEFDIHDALKERMQREILSLKQEVLQLKKRIFLMQQRLIRARIKAEFTRWEVAKAKVRQLYHSIDVNGKAKKLGPEEIQKIQEIYGLISGPSAPAEKENSPNEVGA